MMPPSGGIMRLRVAARPRKIRTFHAFAVGFVQNHDLLADDAVQKRG
jgi:hypothetical protein